MPLGGHQATHDDAGPAINVISWFLISTAFLTVALRAATKSLLTRLAADDILIFVSLLLYLAATIAAGLQVDNGLGQIRHDDDQQLTGYLKARYTGDVFYVLVLTFSKWSILVFLEMLSPAPAHRAFIKILMWVVGLWAISSFIVTVFQCKAPKVWQTSNRESCINRIGFVTYVNVANILFEIALIAVPVNIVARLQMSLWKKILLISCFIARFMVIGSLIAEIIYQVTPNLKNATWDDWPAAIARQMVNSTSIITACIPYYISWVPHAFKIYANVNANKSTGLDFIRPSRMFTRKHSTEDDKLPTQDFADEGIRSHTNEEPLADNSMAIRKTTEWTIRSETGPWISSSAMSPE